MLSRIHAALAITALAVAGAAHAETTAPGTAVDDSTITATIKAALFDNRNTHATRIKVETDKGTVQLSGFVTTQAEKDAAGRIAAETAGVKQVHNSIGIHGPTSIGMKVDDTILTGRVKAALMDTADVKSSQIKVVSEDGIVQLAGFVTSQAMKERAEKVVSDVSGVKRVDNELIVKPT